MPPRAKPSLVLLLIGAALGGCALMPAPATTRPVQRAVEALGDHDLLAVSSLVCAAQPDADITFTIPGLTDALIALETPDALRLLAFDLSGIAVSEVTREGDSASIRVWGVVVEHAGPEAIEQAYRAYVDRTGQAFSQPDLDRMTGFFGDGSHEVPIDVVVTVVLEDGTWKICEDGGV